MTVRVLFHVQHLLGTGHLRRAAAIAAAIAERGMRVVLVSGGAPLHGLALGAAELVQLPPARAADASFRALVASDGSALSDAWRAERAARLMALFDTLAPDVLVIEHYPFGRRLLEFELLPLLERARARARRPLILCSLRDVLVRKADAGKRRAMIERAERSFDRILVHGDPRLIALEATLPEARSLGARVVHTGYVRTHPAPDIALAAQPTSADGRDEVIVSAGGGDVGRALLETAIAARALSRERPRTWRILAAGTGIAPRREPGLVVEGNRTDFTALLSRAHISVSQAGYNTIVDLVTSRIRAVLIPFATAAETEQTTRAEAFAERGFALHLPESNLTPATLAAAIDRASSAPRPAIALDLDGAATSARLIAEWSAT